MSNIIDFKTPAQLREELAAKDEEIKNLKAQMTAVAAVKEMLTLQALDLQTHVGELISQMEIIQDNLENLLNKLSLPLTK